MDDASDADDKPDERATRADDDSRQVRKILGWFDDAYTASEEWRSKAIESYEFLSGNQWSQADLELLNKQKRPALVINKLLRPHLFLSGVQRQQRTEAAVLPFEPSDARAAEMMTYLLKWHSTQSREPRVDSRIFQDAIATGLGFWKVRLDFKNDPMGSPMWERISPLSVFADPNWLDAGWENAKHVIHATWLHIDEAKIRYPKRVEELERLAGETLSRGTSSNMPAVSSSGAGESAGDSLAMERTFWHAKTKRLRLVECWYKETLEVMVAIDRSTGEAHGDPKLVDRIKILAKQFPEMAERFAIVPQEVTQVRVCRLIGDILLDNEPSPFAEPEFPIFPATAHYFWRMPFGQTEPGKDPQRAYNQHRSTMSLIVRLSAHAGWMNKADGGAETEHLEKNLAGVGSVINYQETPPVQIPAPEVPQTLVFMLKASDGEIAEVTAVNPEMVGAGTQRTVSGRALSSRQRAGLVTQEPLLDAFRHDKEAAVLFMVKAIQQYTTPGKAARILGALAVRKPDGPEAQLVQQTPELELQGILQNTLLARFDAVIDPSNKPWEPSIAMARVDQLLEYAEKFPQYVPPDVMIDALRAAGDLTEEQASRFKAHAAAMMQAQMGGPPPGQPAPPELSQ